MEAQAVPREAVTGSLGMLSPRALGLATDARLVKLVRGGNRAAFEAIYERYHRPILSFCRHMLGDPEEAADAVQHTFLAAYNAIVSSDKTILLRAWLFTIARNRCYSMLRSRREQPGGELVEPVTEGLSAQVQRREDLRQLLGDMQRLPHDQRAALVLAELDTLNHGEIGSALGVPPAKVKALVFQARESLIASRNARDIDCAEIRRQLATLRGGALRRAHLRRHLRECKGCSEFRGQVDRQRRSLAAILPVAPSLALKDAVLGGISSSGAAAGAIAGGGLLASTAFKGLALKGMVGGLLALVGIGGTLAAVHGWRSHHTGITRANTVLVSTSAGGSALGAVSSAALSSVLAAERLGYRSTGSHMRSHQRAAFDRHQARGGSHASSAYARHATVGALARHSAVSAASATRRHPAGAHRRAKVKSTPVSHHAVSPPPSSAPAPTDGDGEGAGVQGGGQPNDGSPPSGDGHGHGGSQGQQGGGGSQGQQGGGSGGGN
jgi:RNA polymerase sigma factor (sigma-70 family)